MPRRLPTPSYVGFSAASPTASKVMRANRSEGGRAERLLRGTLWRRGFRYKKHMSSLPGRPDLVFSSARVCVFCDGDFWHGRDWSRLKLQLARRANSAYWLLKIARNIQRDVEQSEQLKTLGWTVLRLWESDILSNCAAAADRVAAVIRRAP
jgi:DNA mismatch endonuclease (patch repair protein)